MINKLFTKKAMAMGMAAVMAVSSVVVFDDTASAAVKNLKKATVAKSITVGKGKKVTIKVTKVPTKGVKKKFTSKNKKVATVTKKGVVTGKKVGKTTVVVKLTYKKKSVTKKVKVTVKNPVKKLTLNQTAATINVGATTDVKVKSVTPKNASKAVTYKTSNKKIAKVTAKGKVTGVAAGTAKITVTAADGSKKKATCAITVVAAPAATVTTAPAVATTPAATAPGAGKTTAPTANTTAAPTADTTAAPGTDTTAAPGESATPGVDTSATPEVSTTPAISAEPTTGAATAAPTTGAATTAPTTTPVPGTGLKADKTYTYDETAEDKWIHLVAVMTNGDLVKYSVEATDTVTDGAILGYNKTVYEADVTAAKKSSTGSAILSKDDAMDVEDLRFTVEKKGEKTVKVTVEATSEDIASLTFYDADSDWDKYENKLASIKDNGVTLVYQDKDAKVTTKCAISAAQLKAIKKANVATTVAVTATAVNGDASEVVEITVDPTNGTIAYNGALAKVYAVDEEKDTFGILKLYENKKLNIWFE